MRRDSSAQIISHQSDFDVPVTRHAVLFAARYGEYRGRRCFYRL